MKRFSFRLQRVLELRRTQLAAAETAWQALAGQQRRLRQEIVQAGEASLEVLRASSTSDAISGATLKATAGHLAALALKTESLQSTVRELATRQEQEWPGIVELRRKVKLLEKLRARRLDHYQREADRALEAEASELHLIRKFGAGRPRSAPGGAG